MATAAYVVHESHSHTEQGDEALHAFPKYIEALRT